jgi:LPS export ABC transporter protein LptC
MVFLKNFRFWLLFLIGAVLASVAFFLFTNQRDRLMPKRFELSGTDADLRIKDVFLTEDNQGIKAWELKAQWAKIYRKDNKTILEDLRIKVFAKGRKPIHITGETGELDNASKNLRIRGNVEVVSEEGFTLRTEEVLWLNEKREIVNEKPVWLSTKGFRLQGKGLLVKVDKQQFFLQEKVTANLLPEAAQDLQTVGKTN